MRVRLLVPSLLCTLAFAAEGPVDQAQALADAGKRAEAIALLEAHLRTTPEDRPAKARLLTWQVAQKEDELRGLIREQAGDQDLMLGDADYEAAKARTEEDVRKRLTAVEYLIGQGRPTEALETVNRVVRDHPHEPAVLILKNRLLDVVTARQKAQLNRDRQTARTPASNEITRKATYPDEPPRIRREVFVFDEDLDEVERAKVTARLQERISLTQDKAQVWDVMQKLFTVAGINYVVLDSAIGEETISLNIQDDTIQSALIAVGKLAQVRFAYNSGTVFVSNDADESLVTEIIRLKSGLTNVEAAATSAAFASGGGEGGNGPRSTDGAAPRQNTEQSATQRRDQRQQQTQNSQPGGNGQGTAAGGQSDLEKFLAKIPDIIVGWPTDGRIYLDRKSNTVYVRSTPWGISELKRLLQALDYNNVQVLIQARFVEVSDNALRELGIAWGAKRGSPTNPNAAGSIGQLGALPKDLVSTGGSVISGLISSDKFSLQATLNALETQGKSDTLAEPKILTLNNAEGLIEIAQNVTYIENYTTQTYSGTGSTSNNNGTVVTNSSVVATPQWGSVDVGYQLKIRPSVARNSDIVTLHLQPSIKDLVRFETVKDGFQYQPSPGANVISKDIQRPVIATRSLDSTLHIENGETVALGGLLTEKDEASRSGTPFVSSIPVLGALFRNDSTKNNRSNLIILVSADIVDPSGAKLGDEITTLRDTARVLLAPETLQAIDADAKARQEAETRAIQAARPAGAAEPGAKPSFQKGPRP